MRSGKTPTTSGVISPRVWDPRLEIYAAPRTRRYSVHQQDGIVDEKMSINTQPWRRFEAYRRIDGVCMSTDEATSRKNWSKIGVKKQDTQYPRSFQPPQIFKNWSKTLRRLTNANYPLGTRCTFTPGVRPIDTSMQLNLNEPIFILSWYLSAVRRVLTITFNIVLSLCCSMISSLRSGLM